jgi:hypothetical protein
MEAADEAFQRWGLLIAPDKTEVMFVNTEPEEMTLRGIKLAHTESFKYLGSHITTDGKVDKEVDIRIGKATGAYATHAKVLENLSIKLSTRLRLFDALVLSTLLYAAETWNMTTTHLDKLDIWHRKALRRMTHTPWWAKVRNEELYARANTTSASHMIYRKMLAWYGHVYRMDNRRYQRWVLDMTDFNRGYAIPSLPTWNDALQRALLHCMHHPLQNHKPERMSKSQRVCAQPCIHCGGFICTCSVTLQWSCAQTDKISDKTRVYNWPVMINKRPVWQAFHSVLAAPCREVAPKRPQPA